MTKNVFTAISMLFVLVTLTACAGGAGDSTPPTVTTTTCTWDSSTWNNCTLGS